MEKRISQHKFWQPMGQTKGLFCTCEPGVACHQSLSLLMNEFTEWSVFHVQVNFVSCQLNICCAWGFERWRKSQKRFIKDLLWKCEYHIYILYWPLSTTVIVLQLWKLFSFCFIIKCWLSGLEITKCLSQGRPWSDCFLRSSLIWVCAVYAFLAGNYCSKFTMLIGFSTTKLLLFHIAETFIQSMKLPESSQRYQLPLILTTLLHVAW